MPRYNTLDELPAHHRQEAAAQLAADTPKVNRQKYNAVKTEIDGITFDSKAEAKRYAELVRLLRANLIADLETQPKFVLQKSFTDCRGNRHRAITYTADFQYRNCGDGKFYSVVEDVKGGKATQTAAFAIKWKLAIKQNPTLSFEIVGGE